MQIVNNNNDHMDKIQNTAHHADSEQKDHMDKLKGEGTMRRNDLQQETQRYQVQKRIKNTDLAFVSDNVPSRILQRRSPSSRRTISRAVGALVGLLAILLNIYWEWSLLNHVYLPDESFKMSRLEPYRLFESYREMHSEESLRRQPNYRKFAIAYYSCPHRAGNMLHSFFNTAIWAIATNRTLLWKYDGETARNTVADCDRILQRASWIPSYDVWASKLSLQAPVEVKMNTRRTKKSSFYSRQEQRESLKAQVVIFPQIPDVQTQNRNISRVSWWEDPRRIVQPSFRNSFYFKRTVHLENAESAELLATLYAEGLYFLYGMFFREMFYIMTKDVLPESSFRPLGDDPKPTTSIAIHSRHAAISDDGSNIDSEIKCFRQFVPAPGPCVAYLMSDRKLTLDRMTLWLQERGCTAKVAPLMESPMNQTSWGKNEEHGPFAGQQFLVDLEFASKGRTAVVGDFTRSSSALLLEMIQYDRKLEMHRHEIQHPGKLNLCELPDRPEDM